MSFALGGVGGALGGATELKLPSAWVENQLNHAARLVDFCFKDLGNRGISVPPAEPEFILPLPLFVSIKHTSQSVFSPVSACPKS